ncbi:MAG: hypothetical protein KDK91_29155, partial [Gammaproteobacteria bacterium]|nr:hypothetical protein [Gammaproteobacteria bacterium]
MRALILLLGLLYGTTALAAGGPLLLSPLTASDANRGDSAVAAQQDAVTPSAEDLKTLRRLLNDPRVLTWLDNRLSSVDGLAVGSATAGSGTAVAGMSGNVRAVARQSIEQLRTRADLLTRAFADLPATTAEIRRLWQARIDAATMLRCVINTIVFLFVGCGLEWLYWRYMQLGLRRLELSRPLGLGMIVRWALARAGMLLGGALLFALGCIGTFAAFDWPPLVGELVLSLLLAVVIVRVVMVATRFVFAPRADTLRLVPLSTARATAASITALALTGALVSAMVMEDTFAGLGAMGGAQVAIDALASMLVALPTLLAILSWQLVLGLAARTGPMVGPDDPVLEGRRDAIGMSGLLQRALPVWLGCLVIVMLILDVLGAHAFMWSIGLLGLLPVVLSVATRLTRYYFEIAWHGVDGPAVVGQGTDAPGVDAPPTATVDDGADHEVDVTRDEVDDR